MLNEPVIPVTVLKEMMEISKKQIDQQYELLAYTILLLENEEVNNELNKGEVC